MELTTLCYIEKEDAYLMLHRVKKQKDVNKDKWIGIGGHFEEGESPEECLLREAAEETGLRLKKWSFRGIVTFCFREEEQVSKQMRSKAADSGMEEVQNVRQPVCEYMHLYTAAEYEGDLTECNEGELVWVKKEEVLSLNIWEGDRIFFDLLMRGEPFFSLKLEYVGDRLERAALNGKQLELLDILDENGNRTGQTRERSLVHADGTWHATSHVWIIKKRGDGGVDVLLQKRSSRKDSFPGCYDISSAGHLPAGSDFLSSAVRELEEELGLKVNPEDLEFLDYITLKKDLEFYGRPFLDRQISAVYLYRGEVDINKLQLQKSEVESVVFMDYDVVLQEILSKNPKYCIFSQEFMMLKYYF